MDPVAAFSLAGTILQFIDSGTRFVGLARGLYRSGSDDTNSHGDLLKLTKSLDAVLPKLKSTASDDDMEKSLNQLALDCGKTTARLLSILQKVKMAENARKRDALKAAFRLICKEDEIKSLQDQLSSFQNQLNLHLLLSLRDYASKSVEQQETVLQQLGVAREQRLSVGGICASILEYLASRKGGLNNQTLETRNLQQNLIKALFENCEFTPAEKLQPPTIQLSQTDRDTAQSLFVASLQYDDMVDRENRIATAHESTFQWVFQDSQSQNHRIQTTKWSNLRDWLESDDQLYWITGKAGSGKSTLMKFLCSPKAEMLRAHDVQDIPNHGNARDQSRCHPYLEKWAGTSGLIVPSFYFWNSGMELQMSRVGLLRTLLCQVVAQRPDILPVISPKEWEIACLFGRIVADWSRFDLQQMLFRAVTTLRSDTKILFFVDGLDEFDGRHEDLISMVQDIIRDNSHVKVCVASRPWNIFQTAFRQKANLRVEDLTFDDIKNFVRSKFHADTEFESLRRRYPSFADKLMDNIVVKASGVFLWVDLVVASLLAGMRLGDRIEDFQRRLDELPPDLEKLYEKILHSLDPFYLEHAAQYFSLVETAEKPLTILQFAFADEESPQSAIKMRLGSTSDEEISLRTEALNRRLNSRCKGFLETDRGLQSIEGNDARHPSQLTIQYLHRTVRDFIKSPKAQSFLRSSTNRRFDPSIQLCVAFLMDMKTWTGRQDHLQLLDREEEDPSTVTNVIHCFKKAAAVAKVNEGVMIELLGELRNLINRPDYRRALDKYLALLPNDGSHVSTFLGIKGFALLSSETLVTLAVIYGVVPYVRAKAEWGGLIRRPWTGYVPSSFVAGYPSRVLPLPVEESEACWPLLLDALSVQVPEPAIVECLLDLGADPNFKIPNLDSQTPWIIALTKVTSLYTLQSRTDDPAEYSRAESKWKQTLRLMFSRGADRAKVPASVLSPISRKILQDLRDEAERTERNRQQQLGPSSWLRSWNLG
ncbi:hypothetical protein K458DRAFT_410325 [Lentithecium fluviatile CBS 122367]|uniref:NACHT domain-containing protein n=1 Tax=Lentithecium fluviatile CBS 122367 TaxID=1168545 RepID=A0A6G1IEI2_9PLEO|nr:hypothetical protein K458DRAFT_410325 [Lentithecium fluviatile CBS 122367]